MVSSRVAVRTSVSKSPTITSYEHLLKAKAACEACAYAGDGLCGYVSERLRTHFGTILERVSDSLQQVQYIKNIRYRKYIKYIKII